MALVYLEIKNHVDLFLILFRIMKKNKLINEKNIKTVLSYTTDLPSLEIKKKELSGYECRVIKIHSPTEQCMRQCF